MKVLYARASSKRMWESISFRHNSTERLSDLRFRDDYRILSLKQVAVN